MMKPQCWNIDSFTWRRCGFIGSAQREHLVKRLVPVELIKYPQRSSEQTETKQKCFEKSGDYRGNGGVLWALAGREIFRIHY